jgi:hypothetical protein
MIASTTLPSNTGYVAAAYLVFLALVLVYVVIMSIRLARTERELVELNALPVADATADRSGSGAA